MKTVFTNGGLAMVEENGYRYIVPVEEQGNLEAVLRGIPYGLPWEEIIEGVGLRATPQSIAAALRQRGIYTAQDLRANIAAAQGAIMSAYGLDLSALLIAVKQYEEVHYGVR